MVTATPTTCVQEGCGQTAAARVVHPLLPENTGPGVGFTIIRPAASPANVGDLLCLDCCHAAVDDMLMAAMPPGQGPAAEQRPDGVQ